MDYSITIDTNGTNPYTFECLNNIDDWVYTLRIESKWFNVFIENKKIKFKNDVENFITKKFNEISTNGKYTTTLSISPDELFKRKLMVKNDNYIPLSIPEFNTDYEDKIKHLDEENKTLKTKNLMLENKIKFIESEIALIKSTLGL